MPHRPGSRDSLRAPIAFLALLVGLSFLAVATTGAGAAGGAEPTKVGVKIVTKSQAKLLEQGKLKVKVKASGPETVEVSATRGRNRGIKRLFKKRTIEFNDPDGSTRKVGLPLTKKGRAKLEMCGTQQINVRARFRTAGKRDRTRRSRTLQGDRSRCLFEPVPLENADRCDFLDPAVCLQPFPNDYFTKADASTQTGRRLNLSRESMPANVNGVHIDPTDMNRGDGFSPGNMIIVKIPGLETPAAFENSNLVGIDDLREYDDPGQAVMVINAETGQRQPIWAELDSNPTTVVPGDGPPSDPNGGINENPSNTGPVNLIIRPAENFDPGERYIVALRNLEDQNGQVIEAPIGFEVYRDSLITDQAPVEQRRPHMESIISDLTTKAGVDRDSLYMAWDFTVASQESLTGRALTIRDDAFERLGDTDLSNRTIEGDEPDVAYTNVDDSPSDVELTRTVEGNLTVPCYLDNADCGTGGKFQFTGVDELTWDPTKTHEVPFRCVIPASVEATPDTIDDAIPGTYGHGLLGTRNQVNGQRFLANQTNTIWCAVDWAGFSEGDIPTVIPTLNDMSNFNKLADRMQQGFVNFMYLSRALTHPDGFVDDPAFQMPAGSSGNVPVIDTNGGRALFMGISQGGIMGGALTALEPNVDNSVLNVPGMNYSTLLRRSVDSDEYFRLPNLGLYDNYPSELERPLLLSLIQLLWDRGEANGYAHNMTGDPLPDTPEHNVLLQLAFGDHQVANITAEVEARTIGASVYTPALEPGRHWEADPFMGIPEVSPTDANPFTGDALMVYYDGGPVTFTGTRGQGTATPPNENVPPREEWGYGDDPHGYPRASQDGRDHAEEWLLEAKAGRCADPDGYCFANGWTGTP